MTQRDLILLALDDSQILSLMERALQAVDYEVAIAHDSEGLEKILDESSPALLLIAERFPARMESKSLKRNWNAFQRFPFCYLLKRIQRARSKPF